MEVVNNPLWAKLLDLSIALFVLFALCVAEAVAIYKLWQQNKTLRDEHATALQGMNDSRLKEAQDYATNRQQATQQNQSVIEQLNKVLERIDRSGTADDKTRRMLLAICEKLNLPLKEFI